MKKQGDFFNPEYIRILFEEVYNLHICRLHPWPEAALKSFNQLNATVYQTMQGPNEFIITGNFKNWNRWNDLQFIHIPTLVIGAKYDTMNPEDLIKMSQLLPFGRVKICENGSHCAMYDDQENYFKAVNAFFADMETK